MDLKTGGKTRLNYNYINPKMAPKNYSYESDTEMKIYIYIGIKRVNTLHGSSLGRLGVVVYKCWRGQSTAV